MRVKVTRQYPQTMGLLGGSGGVVNSLAFYPASLKSLGRTFFKMKGGDNEVAKFTLPNLKAFFKACSQNVSGNKQQLVARVIGCHKPHLPTNSLFSGYPKK